MGESYEIPKEWKMIRVLCRKSLWTNKFYVSFFSSVLQNALPPWVKSLNEQPVVCLVGFEMMGMSFYTPQF